MLSSAFVCSVSVVVAQEFLEPRHLVDNQCPWTQHSGFRDLLKCNDGSSCNVREEGWACCRKDGGHRSQCPSNYPTMCAKNKKTCGKGDHCCSNRDCKPLKKAGGPRICTTTTTTSKPRKTTKPSCSGKSTCRQCLEEDGCAFTTGKCMDGCNVADVPCWIGDAEEKCEDFDRSQADALICNAVALQKDCQSCSATAKSVDGFCQWVGHGCVAAAILETDVPQPCCQQGDTRPDPEDACCGQQCNDEGVFKTALCSWCACPPQMFHVDDGTCCNCVCEEGDVRPDPDDNCCKDHCHGGRFETICHGCDCPSHMVHEEDGTCCGKCSEAR